MPEYISSPSGDGANESRIGFVDGWRDTRAEQSNDVIVDSRDRGFQVATGMSDGGPSCSFRFPVIPGTSSPWAGIPVRRTGGNPCHAFRTGI